MISVNFPGATEEETYVLDAEDIRLASHLSNTHTTDEANRLLENEQFTFIYDLNRNLTEKHSKLPGESNWNYTYNVLDQLIAVSRDGVLEVVAEIRTSV